MKTWNIPIHWAIITEIEIEANTLAEAIALAKKEGFPKWLNLTEDDYIYGGYPLFWGNEDIETIREKYNYGKGDEGEEYVASMMGKTSNPVQNE